MVLIFACMSESIKAAGGAPRPPVWKRLVFGVALGISLLVLTGGVIELALRVAGVGRNLSFHRIEKEADGKKWYRENRWATATYFPDGLIRRPQPMKLPVRKEEGSYRIFVLGSSAAMGDPEASFSISRTLEVMLRNAYPEIRFEVVNAAITAVNSHVVRRIAADCARMDPDLFVVYEGNNEVIGPFGPSGVLLPFVRSESGISLTVALRESRLGQVLRRLAEKAGSNGDLPEEWGGMGMFLDQTIPENDPRLERVRSLFAANLRSIIRSGRKGGADVLLCTVLTNERDFAPFLSGHREGLTDSELEQWNSGLEEGDRQFALGDHGEAERAYMGAWEIDDDHADLAFRIGRLMLAEKRWSDAKRFLAQARDLDLLRFRTDTALNQVIRDSAKSAGEGCSLVDLDKMVVETNSHGIPGDEFLYEHVHLTFWGSCRVAESLFDAVGSAMVQREMVSEKQPQSLSDADLRMRLGYTVYEQAMIIHELLNRFASPPFTGQRDHAARVELWTKRIDTANRLLFGDGANPLPALRSLYEQAINLWPEDWVLKRNYGMALLGLGSAKDAIPWLEDAKTWIDDDPDLLFALGKSYGETGDNARATEMFEILRALEPRYPGLPEASGSQ